MQELVHEVGGEVRFVENELFASTREAVASWADGRSDPLKQEHFYRWMRRESGVLLDDGDPVGGEWNYDDENQEFPADDWAAPPVPTHEYGETTRETAAWVGEAFDTWGEPLGERGPWPVTRQQAEAHLQQFVDERLPTFGP